MIGRRTRRIARQATFEGACDGLDDGGLYGWARRGDAPNVRLEIQQWVNGVLAACTAADQPRPDLAQAGLGACAWRMPLALDPAEAGPQRVEVRVADGPLLPGGVLELSAGQLPATRRSFGVCDGRDGDRLRGWAWRPDVPEGHVEVELWVDGTLAGATLADQPRPDLAAAGLGHGRYGWSLPLTLDPTRDGPQTVELRIRGGGILADGRFSLRREDLSTAAAAASAAVVGRCDGLRGSALHGWAWNPAKPDEPVEVELWIDGVCTAIGRADRFRADLAARRIGRGRHAWRLPLEPPREPGAAQSVEVRAKGGATLTDGAFVLRNDLDPADPATAAVHAFVDSVFAPAAGPRPPPAPAATVNLLYCPEPAEGGPFRAREYEDYRGAMQAFAPVLQRRGEVVEVDSLAAAEALCRARRDAGEACRMFFFGPPRQAPLQAPCPVTLAFAWAFPDLPTGTWDRDLRSDWRNVLRLADGAITFSRFAADAVRNSMGEAYPVAAITPPLALPAQAALEPAWRRTLRAPGVLFDSRDQAFDPADPILPSQALRAADLTAAGSAREVEIEGVLFTSVLDLDDPRSNWRDLVSAFATAHRGAPETTLLLRLAWPDANWPQQLHRHLARLPRFACRVLAVRAPLDPADLEALIAASHWYVTAAKAAGLCLPLQRFMAAGRPAIAPAHTGFADLVSTSATLAAASEPEPWRWPEDPAEEPWTWSQHPDDIGPSTWARVSWPSLVGAFEAGYALCRATPARYAQLADAARERMRQVCDPAAAAAAIGALLARTGAGGTSAARLAARATDCAVE